MKNIFFLSIYFITGFWKKVFHSPPQKIKYYDILCISWHLIGDTFLTLPVIDSLNKTYPQSKITIICKPQLVEILKKINYIDEIIPLTEKDFIKFNKLYKIRKKKYDLVIDFTNNIYSVFITAVANGNFKVGGSFKHKIWGITFHGFPLVYDKNSNVPLDEYITDYLYNICSLMEKQFINTNGNSNYEYDYYKCMVDNSVNNYDGSGTKIGFAIGASRKENLWPNESWLLLANYFIKNESASLFLFGGQGDVANASEIISQHNLINSLVGKLSLLETINKISEMNFFVSNDTGLVHIAIQLGIPTIALVGPSDPVNYFPKNHIRLKVIQKPLFCSSCYKYLHLSERSIFNACNFGPGLCKRLIDVEDIIFEYNALKNKVE